MSKVIMGGVHLASQQDVEAIKKVIDEQYPTLYKYRGNVDTYDNLLLITDSAIGDVYNVLENDKNYAWDGEKWDDLGGMFQIDSSEFVKPKGHVNTVNDLPSMGQASGESKTYHFNLLTDFLANNHEDAPLQVAGYNYVFATRKTNGHYAYVGTNYPEIIEGINILEFEDFIGVVIKVNATSAKPAIIHQVADYNGPLYYDSTSTFHYDTTSPVVIKEKCIVYLSKMENDSWISSNIPFIKYTTPYASRFFYYDSTGNFEYSDAKNSTNVINNENYSLSNPNDSGYVYVKDMSMMSFASDYKGTWVTNESSVKPNALYTVGDNNDVYLSSTDKWIHFASSLYKIYKINISKPSTSGGTTDVGGNGVAVTNAIMDAAKEGKLPLILAENYYGFFFPAFTLAETKTATQFRFYGPAYSQYNSSNTGQVGVAHMYFNVQSNTNGVLVYSSSSIGAGQLMLLNSSRFLSTSNTKAYTPTADYHPATKIYVDNTIDDKLANLPMGESVHYVGHYDTAEGLPSTGQPSGTAIANYFTDTVDRLSLTGATLPNMQGYQYCFGFVDSSSSSNYCYVLTNNPEIITSVGIANGYNYQVIIIDATPEKPAVLYNGNGSYTGPIYRTIQSDGSYNYYPYGSSNGYSTTKKTWLYGSVPNYRMFGVLGNHVIKYTNYAETGYYRKQQDNTGYPFGDLYNQNMVSKSYSNTPKNEGYIYNADMFFIKDADGMAVSFVTSDSIAQENDLAIVGEMNNIYLCVAGPEWIPLAQPHDSYSKEEINAMIGEVDAVLNEILNEPELVEDDLEVPDAG